MGDLGHDRDPNFDRSQRFFRCLIGITTHLTIILQVLDSLYPAQVEASYGTTILAQNLLTFDAPALFIEVRMVITPSVQQ